jgi:hypothetical protein
LRALRESDVVAEILSDAHPTHPAADGDPLILLLPLLSQFYWLLHNKFLIIYLKLIINLYN